ncbi:YeeE/YedE family protein [Poseidonocella sedimentorum]|uniref:Uncharacterized protein n=1 Tax=Poseidonocella sedimentorum TaxID=871652 RepID=A0A1I6DT60_9RHOB|nr:YeeE/YedE thiosulfate transporter family protein [Poseidonocella sedimentorum]SFR08531.1 hypothetical protein SAMN04515673_10585 [Poseidonocella sedimentorum]
MTPVTQFTPLMSFGGGLLIGLAVVLLMAYAGRIFGATGVLAGVISPNAPGDRGWRVATLAGMISGPLAVALITGQIPAITMVSSLPAIAIGGVIVGFGVTLGSGCTSGHGVCGLARLSPRSLVAVPTFMLTTAITIYIIRHVLGGI